MKIIKQAIIGAVALSFASAIPAFAIEGLQISVQSSNVVLSWPSTNIETYIVQYRPTLDATSTWTTLTDYYPAATDTNVTFFIHSNIVQFPLVLSGGTNTGWGTPLAPGAMTGTAAPSVPMVKPANGSGGAVPLALYPPGSDLTGFLIYDPSTGKWMSGDGYAVVPTSTTRAGDTQPMDDSGSGTNQYTGFYRVVRDGVHIWGLTNGTVLSGQVQFPIEFALGSTDQIVGVTFYDTNDNPIIGAYAQSSSSNVWQMAWNTPLSFNGDYTVVAEIDFASDSPVVSVPVTVTASNVISFPNYFSQVFGNQMWIYAQTIPNAAYQLDIYDENTNYLGTFADYADGGGYISFLWDLTDGSGYTHDDTNFYGVFTVDTSSLSSMNQSVGTLSVNSGLADFQTASLVKKTLGGKIKPSGPVPAGNSSSASANQLWVKEPRWTPNDNWVVAYGLFSGNPGEVQNDEDMIVGGPSGIYGGVLGTLDRYGLGGNISPGNSAAGGTVFTVQDQASRTNLLGYLADHRYENFYFFGHGNNSVIGSYNGFILTHDQIAYALANVPLTSQIRHAANHPYRFVYVDACDTGAGNFCEAFAVPAMTVSTNFFAAAGVESRAFIGYKSWKININFVGWQPYSLMTGNFLADWLVRGRDVQTCVNDARNDAYGTGAHMDSSVVIYGAADMNRGTVTRP